MRIIILLLILFFPYTVAAQHAESYIDISNDIKNNLHKVVSSSEEDVLHYSLVKGFRRANIVYVSNDSIRVIGMFSKIRTFEHEASPINLADSIKPALSAVYFPPRRMDGVMVSSDSGKLRISTSSNNGKDWSKFKDLKHNTSSPIIYVHLNRNAANMLVAYFFGYGNLTDSDTTGKSMLYMITSSDNGATWSNPQIAIKHNLYSLNDASIAMYSGRNNKKNELYMVCSSNQTKSSFLSMSSNDGMSWSYPIELPFLSKTDNHMLSINKNKASILFTDVNPDAGEGYGDIYMIITSVSDLKNQKM
ncbi:MAG: sialidase family protein, partial [Rikenellaceae bacterium]